jgi:hypothetical protein
MKIGVVVDGESEFKALPRLFGALESGSGHQILRPILAKITPTAPVPAIARACRQGIRQLEGRRVDKILVVIDLERDATRCPPELAHLLSAALSASTTVATEVVVKVLAFENWLVADVNALTCQPGRFKVSDADKRRVQPNRADRANALAIIKRSCVGPDYRKVSDSDRILGRASVDSIGRHSRSFRRFLRSVEYPPYVEQSAQPAPG